HERGVVEPLLFIADGLPGIEEEIRQLYPRADFPCHRHASRNFESHVRVQDVLDPIRFRQYEHGEMLI
ncbi:hypothetical protein ApAK_08935, partial [Thermoplasmatales archaeon AK]|nr:hypothetical protein [Thermoplasmatales archaeon AK]